MDEKKKVTRVSWFRRFFGLNSSDPRKDPTRGWFVLPPKSSWGPANNQFLTTQPPAQPDQERKPEE